MPADAHPPEGGDPGRPRPPEGSHPDTETLDTLLTRLRDLAATVDQVPHDAELAARSALAWRRLDAELAELLTDSLDEDKELAGVRSGTAADPRLLTFGAEDRFVEVEVSESGDQRELIGQVVPADVAAVQLRTPTDTRDVVADDLGRFRVSTPPGPLSLRCTWDDGTTVETAWITA